ncbi:MAG: hypothetical protein ACI8W3_002422, partial [Myxococcota bacterium]
TSWSAAVFALAEAEFTPTKNGDAKIEIVATTIANQRTTLLTLVHIAA